MPSQTDAADVIAMMHDGREYESLITRAPAFDVPSVLRLAMAEVEQIRGRPLVLYVANTANSVLQADRSISQEDDLSFREMLDNTPANVDGEVDFLIHTPGGSGQQVAAFVDYSRQKYTRYAVIIPQMAMSAGTIWAVSGDEIIMCAGAMLGPTDPQIRSSHGSFIPAQALLTFLDDVRQRGELEIKNGRNPSWTDLTILQHIDPKDIGNAISMSQYSIKLVEEYLYRYKFASWITHSSTGNAVTDAEKRQRAGAIAVKLCDHQYWKTHSAGIPRDVLESDIRLKITRAESIQGLERALRRLWAVIYYSCERSNLSKLSMSQNYAVFRAVNVQ